MILLSMALAGWLFGCGIYLVFHRHMVKVLFGLLMISHAVNLGVISLSGSPFGRWAPIWQGPHAYADPVPQALILTALVIGFGVSAFVIGVLYRLFRSYRTPDLKRMTR